MQSIAAARDGVKTAKLSSNSRKLKPGNAPTQMGSGMNFPVAKLIEIFEPNQWEDFTEEWAVSLEPGYKEVFRWSGAGDMGLDVIGFKTDKKFDGLWDNYQCKRYAIKLQPGNIWVELGKIIYYSHLGEYTAPQNCYFAASKGIGLKLKKLLAKPAELKKGLIENWDAHCKSQITQTTTIPLEGKLLDHLNKFDFRIFKMKSVTEMIKGHASTTYYQRRFGTASFPERPPIDLPPDAIHPRESRYVRQLFEVYSEKLAVQLNDPAQLAKYPEMERHFNRSREIFYHAESLRNFPRDSVDPGAFDAIREEVYHGVVDTYEMDYPDGLTRIRSTLKHAGTLTPNCNALCIRVLTQDKQGLCHHLANEDRFIWVKNNA
jgi:hypothetical protein